MICVLEEVGFASDADGELCVNEEVGNVLDAAGEPFMLMGEDVSAIITLDESENGSEDEDEELVELLGVVEIEDVTALGADDEGKLIAARGRQSDGSAETCDPIPKSAQNCSAASRVAL